jgi:probable HAF family extracellular repeat protein
MFIRCKRLLGLLAFLVFPLVFITTTHTAEVQTYDITDIGTLDGDETSIATGINNSGDVIGISIDKKGRSTAFFWSDGKIKKIGHLDKKHTFVTSINDLGQVVGYSIPDKGPNRAFIQDVDGGQPTDLPTLPGGAESLANSINNSGQVVGRSRGGESHEHESEHERGSRAFQYEDGTITDLQTSLNLGRFGGIRSDAISINKFGRITGHFYTSAHIGYSRAFFHRDGDEPIDLGTLGGKNTVVSGINDADQVVGHSQTLSGELRAFVWDRIHGFLIINPFPGGAQSLAYDINNLGQVVGASESAVSRLRAFIYSGGRMRNLNSLIPADSGWELVTAKAINDRGQIVGEGVIRGERHAFLLTPAP